jgi:hypothetical protein
MRQKENHIHLCHAAQGEHVIVLTLLTPSSIAGSLMGILWVLFRAVKKADLRAVVQAVLQAV